MPIELLNPSAVAGTDEDVSARLVGLGGQPTLEAQVMEQFIDELDFDDFMADADVSEFIQADTIHCRVNDDGDAVECDEGDPGAYALDVETVDGAVLVEFVDADDLYAMFSHYVQTCLPEDTMEDVLRLHAALSLLDEADLDERFKKGDFRKIHAKGGAALVNKMLGAMLNKEAIKRAPKGTGYKKGDYNKNLGGYSRGTASGIKAWSKVVKARKGKTDKNTAAVKSAKQKVGLGKAKKVVAKMKPAVKKGAGKAAAKLAAKAMFGKAKKLVASVEKRFQMTEGAALAGRMMNLAGRTPAKKPLNETQLTGATR